MEKAELLNQPSLPSNLDDAAEEYVNSIAYCGDNVKLEKEQSRRDFIAGVKWDRVKMMKQPEVDLDVEIKKMLNSDYYKRHIKPSPYVIDVINYTARHFYELGLNARKEK